MPELSDILPGMAAVFFGAPGGFLPWSMGLAFASVFLTVLGVSIALRPAAEFRRLDRSNGPSERAVGAGLRPAVSGLFAPALQYKGSLTLAAICILLLLFLGVAWLLGTRALSWVQGIYLASAVAVFAWILPRRLRAWRASRRREALRHGFPDALDMMVVCVEAGLGLDAALNRVAAEIAQAHPPIAAELTQIGRELRAGRERDAVLRSFAHRAGLPEIASFATLLIQSEALGTGIARSLRVQAEEMRASRLLRAEEQAHTLPVKLTIPLVFCILPAMIAVVLLPSAIAIVRDILPNLGR